MGTFLILPNFRQPEKNTEIDPTKRKWIFQIWTKQNQQPIRQEETRLQDGSKRDNQPQPMHILKTIQQMPSRSRPV
jgi:hypothetical protein